MIGILSYGLGNISAIANIYKRLNIPSCIVSEPDQFNAVDKIILPGVGAFDWAISRLSQSGLKDILEENIIKQKKPVLGICVGMQMMALSSEEGKLPGLGWLEGEVKHFSRMKNMNGLRLPHMGWNEVQPRSGGSLFRELESEARFYFLHSFYFSAHNDELILAETDYGGQFASSVGKGNIYGVQFHPEKSHHWGIQLLKNFAEV